MKAINMKAINKEGELYLDRKVKVYMTTKDVPTDIDHSKIAVVVIGK